MGAAARPEGLLGHGGARCASSPASRSRSTWCRRCSCSSKRSRADRPGTGTSRSGSKPADTLTEEERAFCVEQFFHAHRPRMIDPYPALRGAAGARATAGRPSARNPAAQFSTDDIRDLQVWHKLVWIDRDLRRAGPARARAGRQGARLHRRGQADAARGGARDPRTGRARVSRRRRARAGRDLDVAVLPPDPAAAVRHGRLPADASARRRMPRERVPPSARTPPEQLRARRGAAPAAVWTRAGGALAV